MPQLYTTKEDLTYLANAIREVTHSNEKLTFPNGFIQKINEIEPYDWEDEDWMVVGISSTEFQDENLLSNAFMPSLYKQARYIKGYNIQNISKYDSTYEQRGQLRRAYKLNEIILPDCSRSYFTYSIGMQFSYLTNLVKASFPNITSIYEAEYLFASCSNLKEVNLQNCETMSDCGGMFYKCEQLEKVNFTNLRSCLRGGDIFAECINLKTINFPELTTIGWYGAYATDRDFQCNAMFRYCINLSSISLPKCSFLSGQRMFVGCSALKQIDLPECLRVQGYVFSGCSIENFNFPKLQIVYYGAFENCSVKNFNAPKCWYLFNRAFRSCMQLSSISFTFQPFSTKSGVEFSGSQQFYGCKNLETVTIPGCSQIPSECFYNCINLKTINIPHCQIIEDSALALDISFYAAAQDKLETLQLDNCTTIKKNAFNHRKNLKNLILPVCNDFSMTAINGCEIEYLSIGAVSIFQGTFPKTLKFASLAKCGGFLVSAFKRCNQLEEVYAPECTQIGTDVFFECTNLNTININSCEGIGQSAFAGCVKLKNINLINNENINSITSEIEDDFSNKNNVLANVTSIWHHAFQNCSALEELYLPLCTKIEDSAFENCESLKEIKIPLCTTIGEYVFSNCINLTTISLNNSINSLQNGLFYNCIKLTKFTHNNIINIGTNTFANCKALNIISLPNCQFISKGAFNGTKISEAIFPNCALISSQAFKDCYNLSTVILSQCFYVYEQLFENCIKLKTVQLINQNIQELLTQNKIKDIPQTVDLPNCVQVQSRGFYNTGVSIVNLPSCTTLCNEAFMNCFNLTSISLPVCTTLALSVNSVYGIGVFMNCRNLETISLPICSQICSSAFAGCNKLNKIYLNYNSAVVTLSNSNAFSGTLINYWRNDPSNSECSARIYVPSTKLSNYKKAQNWAFYSNLIYAYDFVNNQEV